jgi:hypothetical protein
MEYLARDESPNWQRVDHVALLVCRLPEASLK